MDAPRAAPGERRCGGRDANPLPRRTARRDHTGGRGMGEAETERGSAAARPGGTDGLTDSMTEGGRRGRRGREREADGTRARAPRAAAAAVALRRRSAREVGKASARAQPRAAGCLSSTWWAPRAARGRRRGCGRGRRLSGVRAGAGRAPNFTCKWTYFETRHGARRAGPPSK